MYKNNTKELIWIIFYQEMLMPLDLIFKQMEINKDFLKDFSVKKIFFFKKQVKKSSSKSL